MCSQNPKFLIKSSCCVQTEYALNFKYVIIPLDTDIQSLGEEYLVMYRIRTFFTVSKTASHQTLFSTIRVHCETLLDCIWSDYPMLFNVILPPAPYVPKLLH
jgi:hypothetical protein